MKLPRELREIAKEMIVKKARLNRIMLCRDESRELDKSPLTKEELDEAVRQIIEDNKLVDEQPMIHHNRITSIYVDGLHMTISLTKTQREKLNQLIMNEPKPISQERKAQLVRISRDIDNMPEENQTKPVWITDEQWKINPNVYHWEQERRGAESIARSKPATTQEKLEQITRLRNEKNWKQEE